VAAQPPTYKSVHGLCGFGSSISAETYEPFDVLGLRGK